MTNLYEPEWVKFFEWIEESPQRFVATRDECELVVWWESEPCGSSPFPAWHWSFAFQGVVASSGFAKREATGALSCMRTAVRQAVVNGMELTPEEAEQVARFKVNIVPPPVPDPDRPGKTKPARRVCLDGHCPKKLARRAARVDVAPAESE